MSDEKRTLVEDGTEIRGSIVSSCAVLVRGKVDGDVATPALTVSQTGSVSGKANIGALVCEGELAGEYDADSVRLAGRVKDGTVIRAKTIDVKLAGDSRQQVSFGDVRLDVGDAPRDG
jgi:cytoskeletal protein CcmA (bactofilin family)